MGAIELTLLIASAMLLAAMWTALAAVAQTRKTPTESAPILADAAEKHGTESVATLIPRA